MAKRFYVTTPIYYANSVPHIGTALTTLAADVHTRYRRMLGEEAFFLTGTDENGQKVFETAQKSGKDPHAFVAELSEVFREIWDGMEIKPDDFIRTTEERHRVTCQEFWRRLEAGGHLYKGKYEGWYDVSSETFYREADLVDGKSPDGNEVRWVEEESWFFKLSAFEDRLRDHIRANPDFIIPESRKNEVLSFIDQGLRDISVSRENNGWGVPIPGDEGKVMYVWFDALINYVTAAGWPEPGYETLWPSEAQWMGKDILTRFHATLWPAMLMGVGLPLPNKLIGHAWMLMGGEKISKSKGNVVAPLDLATELSERAGCSQALAIDAVRHYMAATMPYESDATFTVEDFDQRYNADLANDLGNALNRTLSMALKFVDAVVPDAEPETEAVEAVHTAVATYRQAMEDARIDKASAAAIDLIRFLNKYVDSRAPWKLVKEDPAALEAVMRSMLLVLRSAEALVRPMLPATADEIAAQLGLEPLVAFAEIGQSATVPVGHKLGAPKPMFPRLDLKKAEPKPKQAKPKKAKKSKKPQFERPTEIEFVDFMKVHLKVARVIEAERVEGSDKLMKVQVKVGEEDRQVVAGIAKTYAPEDLIGRQVVLAYNLKPAKLMGIESQGMLLAADDADGNAILLQPEAEAPEGAEVH